MLTIKGLSVFSLIKSVKPVYFDFIVFMSYILFFVFSIVVRDRPAVLQLRTSDPEVVLHRRLIVDC